MTASPRPETCHRCGEPIDPGEEDYVVIEQGSGVPPTVVVHRGGCAPAVPIRRYP